MAPLCAVCESPTAFTLHFGGRCCKACAAFFRRTVALDLKYECASSEPCEIHFSMRLVCRECRLRKCYSAGMRPELVRSKRENFSCTRRKDSRGNTSSDGFVAHSNSPLTRHSSSPEDDEWSFQMFEEKPTSVESSSFAHHAAPPPPIVGEDTSRTSSIDAGYCSSYPCSSTAVHPPPSMIPPPPPPPPPPRPPSSSDQIAILHYYRLMETSLCSKRRIMYTNTQMECILDGYDTLQCPFTINDLQPHDWRNFQGLLRHDFAMVFDYATRFPDFHTFSIQERNVFFRHILAVDFILSSAYYSMKLGQPHRQMILTNGEFLCMDPLPMLGNEPNARSFFESDDDLNKYHALMSLHIDVWKESIVPFSQLNVTFNEFCLLKALTVWHVAYYKLAENGRETCRRQRDTIFECIAKLCSLNGVNPENRIGELVMSLNYFMASTRKVTTSYVMLTFFDVLDCDPRLHEMLTFKY